ncbi:hypothetical protein [Pseudorhodobacter antarcticus]|uniref:hypothetical protein n=1 Tax=Pseudorhodobacter antarcticus TaxID=1077947 RepID=UPI00158764D9|nr:hypothetical protein [Pseudorhodobacter antarcticus]
MGLPKELNEFPETDILRLRKTMKKLKSYAVSRMRDLRRHLVDIPDGSLWDPSQSASIESD